MPWKFFAVFWDGRSMSKLFFVGVRSVQVSGQMRGRKSVVISMIVDWNTSLEKSTLRKKVIQRYKIPDIVEGARTTWEKHSRAFGDS